MKALLEKIFGPRPPCACGKKMSALRRNVPIFICACGALKVGKNSITMSPGGTDVLRWSGSQPALAAGDIGMDIATGRPAAFVGAVNSPMAMLSDLVSGLSASIFAFTHISGGVSTGPLGFTPIAAIYTAAVGGIFAGAFTFSHSVGFATGVGALAVATGISQEPGASTSVGIANDADAIGGLVLAPGQLTAFGFDLDVTVFGAGGITLTWSAAVPAGAHGGYLLVLG